jgi:hypothetical protein
LQERRDEPVTARELSEAGFPTNSAHEAVRRRVLDIANPDVAKKNVGDYVQVAGTVEGRAGILRIKSLTMIAPGQAMCERSPLKK